MPPGMREKKYLPGFAAVNRRVRSSSGLKADDVKRPFRPSRLAKKGLVGYAVGILSTPL